MPDIHRTDWDDTTHQWVLRGGLREIFDNTLRGVEVQWPNMFNDNKTDKKIVTDLRIGGFELAEEVDEGQNYPIQSIPIDTDIDYTQVNYATGFRITKQMKKFNQIDLMRKLTKKLGRTMKLTKDIEVAQLWNSPTATYTGFDQQVLGYASHTCLDPAATAYSNIASAAISTTAIESALYYFKMMKDDTAQVVGAKADTIYFEPTQMFTVDELFGSKGMPWEESNTKNPYTKFGLKQFPYIRLSATTAWGLLAKKDDDYDINVFTSQSPQFSTQDAPDTTKDTIVLADEMYTFGFGDARMVFIGNV